MADDLSQRQPQDRQHMNVNEEWELRYWSKEMGGTPDELREAVKAVGVSVSAVRTHLGRS